MSNNTPGQAQGKYQKVIVAGYGPVGRTVVEELENQSMAVTIIDLNPATIQTQSNLGKTIVHGDITDPAVLKEAGILDADAIILTVPDEESVIRACAVARELAPDIFISARTNHVSKAMLATQAGADQVTVEEIITARAMQEGVIQHFTAAKK